MISFGYQVNSGPSTNSEPSLCKTIKLSEIALASTSILEYLESPSISFHAISASHEENNPPPSQPDIDASTITSNLSSLETVN